MARLTARRAPRWHRWWTSSPNPRDSGSATAEFAVALPAVGLVIAFALTLLHAVTMQQQTFHAASVGARVAARGESPAAVERAVRASGTRVSTVRVSTGSGFVTVHVSATAPSAFDWVMPPLRARATAALEHHLAEDATPQGDLP